LKVRDWSFGGNNHPQFMKGTVYLYEEPAWLGFCGWFINSVLGRGCCLFHWIKLSNSIRITRDEYVYTLREYYGDVGDLFYMYVYQPLWEWHYKHPKRRGVEVEIGWERVKLIFESGDPEYFKMMEKTYEDEE